MGVTLVPRWIERDARLSLTDVVVARLGKPAFVRKYDGLSTVAETKLGEDARHMGFHGCCTYGERF